MMNDLDDRRLVECWSTMILTAMLWGCGQGPDNMPDASADSSMDGIVNRPNVLLIVADDMALADLGSFGGEIETPNLDRLAMRGIRLANFHTTPMCAPTRAMLLSGTDHHIAGMGAMPEVAGSVLGREGFSALKQNDGYEGYLSEDVATLPEVLKQAGYRTYMTGKWHLGFADDQTPQDRGFDRSFALLEGGAGHFSDLASVRNYGPTYRDDGQTLPLPENFYSTRYYTEKMMEYIKESRGDSRPFFAYLAYTAPHWPLQAPQESIEKYKNRYDAGFDVLLEERVQGLQNQGILRTKGDVPTFPRIDGLPAWEELTEGEKAKSARAMAIHAAMVDDMDDYIGRLLDFLEESGDLDNTVIAFMSDNGVDGENMGAVRFMRGWPDECCDNTLENMGNADSFVWLGDNWGRALAAPHRMYKAYVSEGGTHTPAFVVLPDQMLDGRVEHTYVSAADIMPTLLDIAGVEVPQGIYNGRQIRRITGRSIVDVIAANASPSEVSDVDAGMELHGNISYRRGDYKILLQRDDLSTGRFQLYNIVQDPAETYDLSEEMPEVRDELISAYESYAQSVGIKPWREYLRKKE